MENIGHCCDKILSFERSQTNEYQSRARLFSGFLATIRFWEAEFKWGLTSCQEEHRNGRINEMIHDSVNLTLELLFLFNTLESNWNKLCKKYALFYFGETKNHKLSWSSINYCNLCLHFYAFHPAMRLGVEITQIKCALSFFWQNPNLKSRSTMKLELDNISVAEFCTPFFVGELSGFLALLQKRLL